MFSKFARKYLDLTSTYPNWFCVCCFLITNEWRLNLQIIYSNLFCVCFFSKNESHLDSKIKNSSLFFVGFVPTNTLQEQFLDYCCRLISSLRCKPVEFPDNWFRLIFIGFCSNQCMAAGSIDNQLYFFAIRMNNQCMLLDYFIFIKDSHRNMKNLEKYKNRWQNFYGLFLTGCY